MKALFTGTTVVALLFILLLIAPLIFLASLNTIFEQANVDIYIPHNIWTYLSSYGIMIVLRGGKS